MTSQLDKAWASGGIAPLMADPCAAHRAPQDSGPNHTTRPQPDSLILVVAAFHVPHAVAAVTISGSRPHKVPATPQKCW